MINTLAAPAARAALPALVRAVLSTAADGTLLMVLADALEEVGDPRSARVRRATAASLIEPSHLFDFCCCPVCGRPVLQWDRYPETVALTMTEPTWTCPRPGEGSRTGSHGRRRPASALLPPLADLAR